MGDDTTYDQRVLERKLAATNAAIDDERLAASKIKEGLSSAEWKSHARAATKKFFNLLEERFAVQLAIQFPDRTFYTQVRIVGLVDKKGKLHSLKELGLEGRIPDLVELRSDRAKSWDLKTRSAIAGSAKAVTDGEVLTIYRPKSHLKKEIANEEAIVSKATAKKGWKIAFEGNLAGQSESRASFNIAPSDYQTSTPVAYDVGPQTFLGEEGGASGKPSKTSRATGARGVEDEAKLVSSRGTGGREEEAGGKSTSKASRRSAGKGNARQTLEPEDSGKGSPKSSPSRGTADRGTSEPATTNRIARTAVEIDPQTLVSPHATAAAAGIGDAAGVIYAVSLDTLGKQEFAKAVDAIQDKQAIIHQYRSQGYWVAIWVALAVPKSPDVTGMTPEPTEFLYVTINWASSRSEVEYAHTSNMRAAGGERGDKQKKEPPAKPPKGYKTAFYLYDVLEPFPIAALAGEYRPVAAVPDDDAYRDALMDRSLEITDSGNIFESNWVAVLETRYGNSGKIAINGTHEGTQFELKFKHNDTVSRSKFKITPLDSGHPALYEWVYEPRSWSGVVVWAHSTKN